MSGKCLCQFVPCESISHLYSYLKAGIAPRPCSVRSSATLGDHIKCYRTSLWRSPNVTHVFGSLLDLGISQNLSKFDEAWPSLVFLANCWRAFANSSSTSLVSDPKWQQKHFTNQVERSFNKNHTIARNSNQEYIAAPFAGQTPMASQQEDQRLDETREDAAPGGWKCFFKHCLHRNQTKQGSKMIKHNHASDCMAPAKEVKVTCTYYITSTTVQHVARLEDNNADSVSSVAVAFWIFALLSCQNKSDHARIKDPTKYPTMKCRCLKHNGPLKDLEICFIPVIPVPVQPRHRPQELSPVPAAWTVWRTPNAKDLKNTCEGVQFFSLVWKFLY